MKNTILLLSLLSLAACGQSHEDLEQWITRTQKEAKARAKSFTPPTVTPPKAYIPPPYSGLNAFDARRLNLSPSGENAPDLNRPKEVLETFSLENISYVGRLINGNKISGYVRAGDHVYTVSIGNYIGQNYGKIQKITEDKIILDELVEDSYGNWVYRTAELALNGTADLEHPTGTPTSSTPTAPADTTATPSEVAPSNNNPNPS